MQAGDLVQWRRDRYLNRAETGIAVTNIDKTTGIRTVWWTVVWSNGKATHVNERNLRVINASR